MATEVDHYIGIKEVERLTGLTPEGRRSLAEFLNDETGFYPTLADLPYWWDRIPPDAMDSNLPNYTQRTTLLAAYNNWAFTKPWAWEGLQRLLGTLRDRQEPIPDILQWWAYAVASGRWQSPGQGRGRKENAERNARIMHSLSVLTNQGFTNEASICEIAGALCCAKETVRSAIRKVRQDWPFR